MGVSVGVSVSVTQPTPFVKNDANLALFWRALQAFNHNLSGEVPGKAQPVEYVGPQGQKGAKKSCINSP